MSSSGYNCVVLLGPTAVGKTWLGARLAHHFGWPVISADSRQVYKGLDIGSGKDLAEYTVEGERVPCHLIDCATLDTEYNVFAYQRDFYALFAALSGSGTVPLVVGGTGMYVDAVIRGYGFVPVPENAALRSELSQKPLEELSQLLLSLKPDLHTTSTLRDRGRMVRAIEIELFMRSADGAAARALLPERPPVRAFVLGTTIPRAELREAIGRRLRERMENGLIEEVQGLHDGGITWERLERLGLEYRFVSEYLESKRGSRDELYGALYHAICQFAKRQETWFRGMEKKGVAIHWLPAVADKSARYMAALDALASAGFMR